MTIGKQSFLTLMLCLCLSVCFGQTKLLDKQTVHITVRQIADTIARHYVFVERRKSIRDELLNRLKSGRYDTFSSWPSFKTHITKEVRDISHDKHLFVIYDPKTIQVLKSEEQRSPEEMNQYFERQAARVNYGFDEVKVMAGNIGYLKLSEINFFSQGSVEAFQAAAEFLKNTDALVVDMRDNGGGGDDTGPIFVSWFLKKNTPLLGFKTATTKTINYGQTMTVLPVKRRVETPLYILINRRTGSAAEAYTYVLQNYKRAIVVGEPSAGAANASEEYAINNFVRFSVSVSAPVSPVTYTNWELVGVQPDQRCKAEHALEEAHLSALKQLVGADPELSQLIQTLEAKRKQD